jgi:hypothetical protein
MFTEIKQGKKGEWIMEIKVEKPTRQFLEDRRVSSWGIWEKEVSRFNWHYDAT